MMKSCIQEYLGKDVRVTLLPNTTPPVKGKLSACDGSFVLLEQDAKSRLIIPISAILHIFAVQ